MNSSELLRKVLVLAMVLIAVALCATSLYLFNDGVAASVLAKYQPHLQNEILLTSALVYRSISPQPVIVLSGRLSVEDAAEPEDIPVDTFPRRDRFGTVALSDTGKLVYVIQNVGGDSLGKLKTMKSGKGRVIELKRDSVLAGFDLNKIPKGDASSFSSTGYSVEALNFRASTMSQAEKLDDFLSGLSSGLSIWQGRGLARYPHKKVVESLLMQEQKLVLHSRDTYRKTGFWLSIFLCGVVLTLYMLFDKHNWRTKRPSFLRYVVTLNADKEAQKLWMGPGGLQTTR